MLDKELTHMQDVRGQQLDAMRKVSYFAMPCVTANAYAWVQSNKKRFKDRVLGPVVLGIEVRI